MSTAAKEKPREICGIGASNGIAIGPAFHLRKTDLSFEPCVVEDVQAEWKRCKDALHEAFKRVEGLHRKAAGDSTVDDAAIFKAHGMMLKDPEFLRTVRTAIEKKALNAESAVYEAAESYAQLLEEIDDEHLSARAADVRDVAQQVIRILLDVPGFSASELTEPSIILARDLTPSDTMLLDQSLVLGFCTVEGGRTSHTAILARGLGLPAVVGAGPEVLKIGEGNSLVLDGTAGTVLVHADDETIEMYRNRQEGWSRMLKGDLSAANQPAVTRDGQVFGIVANISSVDGAESAIKAGAEGVGLLRTEFLYLERDQLPDEEEQYRTYRAIADIFGKLPVVLRTLDIGGDKELPYLNLPDQPNPFLGVRAIRLCLARLDLFKTQLRAALRAAAGRNLKIMFPMVTDISELRAARRVLEECQGELIDEGYAVSDGLEVGIMVEVPATALMAHHLAGEVDFFSIGTNDLTQYTMAADRTNAAVASLVTGFHPAVLRLVRDTIVAAHSEGKTVGLCGELAGEPLAIPILVGLGLDEFSMNPPAIARAKRIIRQLSMDEARKVARQTLDLKTPEAVKRMIRRQVSTVAMDEQ
jgi:phosphotransferase system enzyme I (PtsI)